MPSKPKPQTEPARVLHFVGGDIEYTVSKADGYYTAQAELGGEVITSRPLFQQRWAISDLKAKLNAAYLGNAARRAELDKLAAWNTGQPRQG